MAMEGIMMRSLILAPAFLLILGADPVKAQYDFYDFMNSSGYEVAPQQDVSLSSPRLAQNGEVTGNLDQPLVDAVEDLATLDELGMIESPMPQIPAPDIFAPESPSLSPPVAESVVEQMPAALQGQSIVGSGAGELVGLPPAIAAPQLINQQQRLMPIAAGGCGDPATGCASPNAADHCGGYGMGYRLPILPPPTSLYGYFNSPPSHAHLWDSYPQQAAARAAHWQQSTGPYQGRRCVRGELVEPCH